MADLSGLCESWRQRAWRWQQGLIRHGGNWRHGIPAPCPLCGLASRSARLCAPCEAQVLGPMRGDARRCLRCALLLAAHEVCPDCQVTPGSFDRVRAVFDYELPASVLIHRLKAQRRFTDVPMLAGLLANTVARVWPDRPPGLVLVPVPGGARSVRRRGFNPAAEVGRVLARRLDCAYRPALLQRVHDGVRQASLGREARMVSTAGLYRVASNVAGLHIAVVDDVFTTGSTMHSIARMLKRGGATSVHGLVLARTQRRFS